MTGGVRTVLAEPEGFSPRALGALGALGPVTSGPFDRARLLDAVATAEVLWVRLAHVIDAEVLAAAPSLRTIVTATTGLDHIDRDAAARHGVTVLSLRGETELLDGISSTAEHTWGLLLALVRRIPWAFDDVRAGNWDRDRFRGRDLDRRRLGVIGCGRLGTKVAAYGVAFGMEVRVHDVVPVTPPPGATVVDGLATLLASSDVVSVHVHLDETTHHLLGDDELAALPPGAVVVNTARGAVIDSRALLDALERGHLGGAAVDVVEGEPDPWHADRALLEAARTRGDLLVTPHVGGATHDAMARTEEHMADKLIHHLETEGACP